MKTLLIVRHAKTFQAEWGETDFDRKLTSRGKENAEEIAGFVLNKKIKTELLVSSPAKRTKQTCKIFAEALDINKKKIQYEKSLYEAPANAYNALLKRLPDNKNCIAIFGHNNGITQFANDLLPDIDIAHLPTGAVVAVTADVKKWSSFQHAEKKLLFFEAPKGHLS